jgi:hypothetical protein
VESQASVYDWFEQIDRRSVTSKGTVDPSQP